MDSFVRNDPAFLETCHRWLLFHYHCNDCGHGEDACEYGKVCSYGKSTFTHVQACNREECSYPRCDLIKSIIRHHQNCKDEDCQVCSPVCKYQARSKPPPPPPQPLQPPSSPYAAESSPGSAASSMQGSEPPPPPSLPPHQSSTQQAASQFPLYQQHHLFAQQLQSQPQPQQRQQQLHDQLGDGMAAMQMESDGRPQPPPSQQQQQQQQQSSGGDGGGGPSLASSDQGGMLFEARHRERKRHFSGHGLMGPSGTWSTSELGAAASTLSSVAVSGGSMTSARSGSLDALAELQALHLGHASSQPSLLQPQQQQQQGHQPQHQRQRVQQPQQGQQGQQGHSQPSMQMQADQPFMRLSSGPSSCMTPEYPGQATPQQQQQQQQQQAPSLSGVHPPPLSARPSGSAMQAAGTSPGLASGGHVSRAMSMPDFAGAPNHQGMQQHNHPQPNQPTHAGLLYGTSAGAVPAHLLTAAVPAHHQPLTVLPAGMHPGGPQPPQPPHITSNASIVQQPGLPTMLHFTTGTEAHHPGGAASAQAGQHPHQSAPGFPPGALSGAAGSGPVTAPAGLMTGGPAIQTGPSYLSLPYGTFVQAHGQHAVHLAAPVGTPPPGMTTFAVVHHAPMYGHPHHTGLHPQAQLGPTGPAVSSQVQHHHAPPGIFLSPPSGPSIAAIPVGCGPSAGDVAAAGGPPSWGFVPPGSTLHLVHHGVAPPPPHGHFTVAGPAGPAPAPVMLAPKMAGAT